MRSAIAVALCAVGLSAAAAEPVTYLDWDDERKEMTNATCTTYEVVTAETATFAAGKTYVVTNDVINASDPLGITVEGTSSNPTRLILCDGAKLTVTGQSAAETAGLNVSNGTAIVICGQKGGTGVLETTGGAGAAGIGGNAGQAAGTVTIYGGSVTALGKDGAAGIGGGMNKTDTGTVTFGGTGFSVVTGKTATVTAPIAQGDYVNDHSATYVHIEPAVVAQFVKGGEVVAEFKTADEAVAALDDAQYADIEEFRIGLVADTEFDFGGRTNRVVILNVGAVTNTLKNVFLDGTDCAVTGSVGRVVFGDGVRIEKSTLGFKQGWVDLIIKGGLYKNDPIGYCEDGSFSARRYDENEHLNGLYAVLPAAEIAVEDRKEHTSTRYATLQDAFNLIGENKEVTLRLFSNLKLGTAVAKLEGNKSIRLLPGEPGTNTITRVGKEPVIEIGRGAKLEISNVIFDGANVTSEKPMIEVAGKTGTNFGWLIAGDGFEVSNAVGGAVHVGNGGKFELDGVAKIIDNTTGGKPKNVIIEDSKAIVLKNGGAVTDGNYAQIGVSSDTDKFMIPGGQFGAVDLSYEYATYFSDGDISVAKPWVGFINDRDGSLHHAAGAKIAAAPKAGEGKKTYKRWVGGEYKVTLEEGDYLISRVSSFPSSPTYLPELIWTARQDAPAAEPAPAVLDWTDTTLTLAVSNGCDYAVVTDGMAETNWVSMVGTDNTYAFARPAGGDYLCLRRYSITPSNIVSAATAYSVRIPAGTKEDPWTVGEGVTAWTNGNEFVVSGDGTVSDLSKLASKVTVEKLTIKDATVTVAASDAFQGFGASGSEVSLTLPDNWQGDLPDEEGNWYGARNVSLTAYPLTVKNVEFLQRYPWNGKVDVGFMLTGPAGETNVVVTVCTNGTKIADFTVAVTIPADGVLATNLVWDAETAGLAANFKSDDVTVEVKIAASDIAAKSEAGVLDLTVGDRVAKDTETLVVDPAWDETDPTSAKVLIDGEDEPRTYTCASNDLWQTASLEPGRYEAVLMTACSSYLAGFWKVGDDWTVFDSSNITADVTFEPGKTYLMLGTNTVAGGVTLKVADGAKFFYGEGVPSGFLGEEPAELPKRYETKTVGDLYQIVEKIKGCEDNPWEIGEGVTAYTNGNELVIGGAGTVGALSGVDGLKDLLAGLTAINVTSNGVTGAEAQAFADVGTDGGSVLLTLPDGWQGELPKDGNWYGATGVTLTAYPLAVRNIQTATHWPWDGKIDITCDLTGKGEVNLSVALTTNGVAVCEATTLDGETAIDLGKGSATNGVRLVWSAQRDIADANFNAANAVIEVTAATKGVAADPAVGGVQLWEGGPIWAGCNVGATTSEDDGNLYLFSKDKAKAAAESLGAGWRLPTKDEFDNLLANCDSQWDTTKRGWMFTGKDTYASKSVFFRAAGRDYYNDGRKNANYEGNYWSSTEGDPNKAWILYFSYYVSNPKIDVRSNEIPDYAFSVRAVRDAPSPASEISSASDAFRFDLREAVALAEGETTVSNVTYSATLWGEAPDTPFTTVGYTNLATGATGALTNGLVDAGTLDVTLPKVDGDYVLTHSTGDLTSFVKFTVSGYPLGCETNPWIVGAGDNPENVVAWTDGNGNVYFKPARSAVSREGLDAVTNAMGGASFPAKLISEDGSETNDLVMVLGASGTVYDTIAEVLYADEASCTLFDVNGYLVSYNGGEGALGTMATDKFIPTVPTNLTANAYTIVGYEFAGWTKDGTTVAYTNRQEGVDFAQPGETLALTALWTQVGVEPVGYTDLADKLAKVTRPVTFDLVRDIEIPADGTITVPAGKDVTFAGIGKFDVTAERPALFNGYPVGTGLKPEDLDRFRTDKDVKAYYEDGKVVVRGRGETEEFPWLIGTDGHEDEVTAWAGDGMILAKPVRGTASVAALQSVTNALSGYVPGPGELKVISADGTATNDVVMLLGDGGVAYDTLADVLAAKPQPTTVRLFEVNGYFVSYDGNGAAGTMATDMFIPTVPTNLTANAYEIIGYAFAGWSTNGTTKAYDDRAAGVDFAQPGETLALTALWTQVETKAATYADLTNLIAQATLPVTLTLDEDIVLQPGDKVVIPAGKSVTFAGEGRFDVSGIVPQFGEPVVVGEGFADEDALALFDADGVSKLVFEDGMVGLIARGESEDFPWILDEANGVTAWVDEALTNLAGVVIDNGLPTVTNAIDLVALTNNLATYGYGPTLKPLNALLAVGKDGGAPEYVKPVNWIGEKGEYATLEAALAAGETAVVPNFETKETEIPQEIVETSTDTDGKTYTAVVENKPAADVAEPVKAIYAEGLINIATNEKVNVTLVVTPSNKTAVVAAVVKSLAAANTNGVADVVGYTADYVDLSLYFNADQQSEIGETLAIHVPWTVNPRQVYRISRIHAGVAEPLPVGADNAVGGEYVEILADGFIIHAKKYSLYSIGEITLQPRFGIVVGNGSKTLGEPDPSYIATNFTVNVQGLDIEPGDIGGYCVRAKGEAVGDYAINFICTRMPDGIPAGAFTVVQGTFTIDMGEKLPADGTVTMPKTAKGSEFLRPNAYATWRAKPDKCSVFVKWVAAEGASAAVTNLLTNAGEAKCAKTTLMLKIPAEAEVRPTDIVAMWKRIDEDVPEGQVAVMLRCDSTMGKATGSGLYKLTFNKKTGVWSKKVSINATANKDYVFAGWYEDPGFSEPASFVTGTGTAAKPKDYRNAAQSITVTTNTYLFARFVSKTTKADPITWLRYEGAGYCGGDASWLAEEETWYQGVALPTNACAIAFGSASLPTVTVSGLPSGVKYDKVTQRFTGVPTVCSTAKKPFFTVKISVKNKSGATDVLVKYVTVEPLPAWAVGNFDGYHVDEGVTNGTFAATVGKTGKVSGKTAGGLASTSFSAKSFCDVFTLDGENLIYAVDVTVSYKDPLTKKTVKQVDTLYLMEDPSTGLGTIGGGDKDGCGCVGVQRAWDRKDLAYLYRPFATGKAAPTLALDNGITLKFGAKGRVTLAGKMMGDNGKLVTVSGSTYVLPSAWTDEAYMNLLAQVPVYVAPKKTTLPEGFCEVLDVLLKVGAVGKFDDVVPAPPSENSVKPYPVVIPVP